jgi:hypothetical protein
MQIYATSHVIFKQLCLGFHSLVCDNKYIVNTSLELRYRGLLSLFYPIKSIAFIIYSNRN